MHMVFSNSPNRAPLGGTNKWNLLKTGNTLAILKAIFSSWRCTFSTSGYSTCNQRAMELLGVSSSFIRTKT